MSGFSSATIGETVLVQPNRWWQLALGIVCIALSAIFVKLAVGVPGTVSAFYRVAIAAVALAIPFARGQSRKNRATEATSRVGWRIWALAIVGLVAAKAFLIDMAGLTGLWRVLSFLGLGLVLIGLGTLYRRFVPSPG